MILYNKLLLLSIESSQKKMCYIREIEHRTSPFVYYTALLPVKAV